MRTYNNNISARANESLTKREKTVKLQKRAILISLVMIVSLIILLGSSIHALANSSDNRPVNKYYTSITVENGDTLWNIADEYISGYDIDKNDYIAEVSALNNLSKDEIHAGQSIVVAYYTRDVKQLKMMDIPPILNNYTFSIFISIVIKYTKLKKSSASFIMC